MTPLIARHYRTGAHVELTWQDGVFTEINPVAETPTDLWIAPGLVDVQINGVAGVDFQKELPDLSRLKTAVGAMVRAGCTRFLPTLITDQWDRMLLKLERLVQWRAEWALAGHCISGWHLEGPFLSETSGYHGAHNPQLMQDPSPRHLQAIRDRVGKDLVLVTLAPERSGALEFTRRAVELGWKVSLGHTNASAQQMVQAYREGARAFTHLGNACPQLLDRFDNVLWRVLDEGLFLVSLIPDGVHVSPALFRLVHRLQPGGGIYYTTDAMSAAGGPSGRYTLGELELEVGRDGVVRFPGQSHYAGSALMPWEGVVRAARMLKRSWREVWNAFSIVPAGWLGIRHGLEVGAPADVCLVRESSDGCPELIEVRVCGRPLPALLS